MIMWTATSNLWSLSNNKIIAIQRLNEWSGITSQCRRVNTPFPVCSCIGREENLCMIDSAWLFSACVVSDIMLRCVGKFTLIDVCLKQIGSWIAKIYFVDLISGSQGVTLLVLSAWTVLGICNLAWLFSRCFKQKRRDDYYSFLQFQSISTYKSCLT